MNLNSKHLGEAVSSAAPGSQLEGGSVKKKILSRTNNQPNQVWANFPSTVIRAGLLGSFSFSIPVSWRAGEAGRATWHGYGWGGERRVPTGTSHCLPSPPPTAPSRLCLLLGRGESQNQRDQDQVCEEGAIRLPIAKLKQLHTNNVV